MRIGVRHGGVVSQNVDVRVSVGLLPVVCADCQCGCACTCRVSSCYCRVCEYV